MKKKNLLILFFAVVMLTFSACGSQNTDPINTEESQTTQRSVTTETVRQTTEETKEETTSEVPVTTEEANEEDIMSEFEVLFEQKEVDLKEIGDFVKEHIGKVSAENASLMVLKMESHMMDRLSEMEENFSHQTVQKKFLESFSSDIDLNDPEDFNDSEIKELIRTAKENGYKVDHAEGMFFPILDYAYLKNFSEYATPEVRDYIDILAIETEQAFAKDAALLIEWDEVIRRALMQEKYINEYDQSERTDYVKALYARYVYITLSGLDNTPLFDYETKTMKEEAKKAYEAALNGNEQSEYITMLSEFMELIEKNDYKLTDELTAYRMDKLASIIAFE
jgi:hypothetical protein